MKSAFALAAVIGLLWPATALADPSDCSRRLRQIHHFEGMVERAEEGDKDDWAKKMQRHVDQLEDHLASRCPSFSDRDEKQEAARQLAILMKVAADAAITIFTLGAL